MYTVKDAIELWIHIETNVKNPRRLVNRFRLIGRAFREEHGLKDTDPLPTPSTELGPIASAKFIELRHIAASHSCLAC